MEEQNLCKDALKLLKSFEEKISADDFMQVNAEPLEKQIYRLEVIAACLLLEFAMTSCYDDFMYVNMKIQDARMTNPVFITYFLKETDCDIKDSESMFSELIDLFQDADDSRISPRILLEGDEESSFFPEKMTISEICARWNVAKQQVEARFVRLIV